MTISVRNLLVVYCLAGAIVFANQLYSFITNVPYPGFSSSLEVQMNVYYTCLHGVDLIVNALNRLPLTTTNFFSRPILTPDWDVLRISFILMTLAILKPK
jgi:hypothetical protein